MAYAVRTFLDWDGMRQMTECRPVVLKPESYHPLLVQGLIGADFADCSRHPSGLCSKPFLSGGIEEGHSGAAGHGGKRLGAWRAFCRQSRVRECVNVDRLEGESWHGGECAAQGNVRGSRRENAVGEAAGPVG
jgi:hypothetical protein